MITPESIARLETDSAWKPWAAKGWTLHHAPGGRVLAVNGALGRATESVTRITTLIGRLEKGAFGYKQFWTFKQFNTP